MMESCPYYDIGNVDISNLLGYINDYNIQGDVLSMAISNYVNRELPTWFEVWEFYNEYIATSGDNSIYWADDGPGVIHPYWKIPLKLYQIIINTNYLNRILYEESGMMDKVIQKTKELTQELIDNSSTDMVPSTVTIPDNIKEVRWLIDWNSSDDFDNNSDIVKAMTNPLVPIYTFTDQEDPFIRDKSRRINVYKGELGKGIGMSLYWLYEKDGKLEASCAAYGDVEQRVLEFMLHDVIEYFKPPVGWKDENGQPIAKSDSEWNRNLDPAL